MAIRREGIRRIQPWILRLTVLTVCFLLLSWLLQPGGYASTLTYMIEGNGIQGDDEITRDLYIFGTSVRDLKGEGNALYYLSRGLDADLDTPSLVKVYLVKYYVNTGEWKAIEVPQTSLLISDVYGNPVIIHNRANHPHSLRSLRDYNNYEVNVFLDNDEVYQYMGGADGEPGLWQILGYRENNLIALCYHAKADDLMIELKELAYNTGSDDIVYEEFSPLEVNGWSQFAFSQNGIAAWTVQVSGDTVITASDGCEAKRVIWKYYDSRDDWPICWTDDDRLLFWGKTVSNGAANNSFLLYSYDYFENKTAPYSIDGRSIVLDGWIPVYHMAVSSSGNALVLFAMKEPEGWMTIKQKVMIVKVSLEDGSVEMWDPWPDQEEGYAGGSRRLDNGIVLLTPDVPIGNWGDEAFRPYLLYKD